MYVRNKIKAPRRRTVRLTFNVHTAIAAQKRPSATQKKISRAFAVPFARNIVAAHEVGRLNARGGIARTSANDAAYGTVAFQDVLHSSAATLSIYVVYAWREEICDSRYTPEQMVEVHRVCYNQRST